MQSKHGVTADPQSLPKRIRDLEFREILQFGVQLMHDGTGVFFTKVPCGHGSIQVIDPLTGSVYRNFPAKHFVHILKSAAQSSPK